MKNRIENTPTLETERLILRRFTENDTGALFQLLSDREVNTFLPLYPLETIEEAREHLRQNYLERYRLPDGYRYAVCLKSNDWPIGYVDVGDGESRDFGYALLREFWRQGIITEAARAVTDRLREAGYSYITATHDVNNPASGKVMQKLGMTYCYSYEELVRPKNVLVTFRMYQLNLDGQAERVYRGYWEKYSVHFVEKDPV